MKYAVIAVALLLCGPVLVTPSMAHEVRPTYLEIEEIVPNHFDVLWKQPRRGRLGLRLEPRLSNGLLDGPPDELYVTGSFTIRRWVDRRLSPQAFEGATLRIEGLERGLIDALVSIRFASGQEIQALLSPTNPALTVSLSGSGGLPVFGYMVLGVQHVLTGFDHLSFVLGLLLLVRGGRSLVATISAFTLAHSITLAGATLGYLRFNSSAIEVVVALSIVFVAVELTRYLRGRPGFTTGHPWLVAFSFGLFHGLAFAGSLAEVGLPSRSILGALLLFNCGVEAGQLIFVGAVLTATTIIRRWGGVKVGNNRVDGNWLAAYGVGVVACYSMFDRVEALIR